MSTAPAPDACDYCGLPLAAPWWRRARKADSPAGGHSKSAASSEQNTPSYCCVGCRIAAQVTRERGEEGAVRWTFAKLGLAVFFTMNVFVFSMALWSEDFYTIDSDSTTTVLIEVFRYLSLLFAVPVLFLLGEPLLRNAWDGTKRGVFSTDFLLLSGIAAAYVYSAVSVFRGEGHIYFEVGCVVLVLVTLGRWMEATGRLRSTAAIDGLEKLLPSTVRVLRDKSDRMVPLAEIVAGDMFRVCAGERVPVDGVVVAGSASVDQQVLTGESWPTLRQSGDSLFGGTLNVDGELQMRATASPSEGAFRRLIEAVRRARSTKGKYERIADRAAQLFLPAVAAVAVLTFAFHFSNSGWEAAILHSLAVVLIACPCALGIATPMAVCAGMGRAVQDQILFQSSEALERLANVRAIYFDKTGTLTTGTPAVVECYITDDRARGEVLQFAELAAAQSTHPLSRAVLDFVRSCNAEPAPVPARDRVQSQSYPGQGIVVELDEDQGAVYLGSRRFLAGAGLQINGQFETHYEDALTTGMPVVLLGWTGHVKGMFTFHEQLRPEVPAALDECRNMGLHMSVLTGDHFRRAHTLSVELNLPVEAELLPEDKMARIAAARAKYGSVAMIGDGLNDAPALAASDVGIALGCGADVSRDSAGVCLLGNDLTRIPWAIRLARQTVNMIQINLFWAFAYNVFGLFLAAGGWLNPATAALFMVLSSVLVIVNSLRLVNFELQQANVRPADLPSNSNGMATKASDDHTPEPLIRSDSTIGRQSNSFPKSLARAAEGFVEVTDVFPKEQYR